MSKGLRFWAVVAVLIFAGIVVNGWAYFGESRVHREPLNEFPKELGNWKQEGGDQRFDAQTLSVLRASDYLLRSYRSPHGQRANLYVGYYETQRDGSSYHSPLNCLPGSGWSLSDHSLITIRTAGGQTFVANKYAIQNGNEREMMIYWYQARGRAIASEYWSKVYTVIDSVRRRRSDAAMVRVLVPVTATDDVALAAAADFAAETTTALPTFIPN